MRASRQHKVAYIGEHSSTRTTHTVELSPPGKQAQQQIKRQKSARKSLYIGCFYGRLMLLASRQGPD